MDGWMDGWMDDGRGGTSEGLLDRQKSGWMDGYHREIKKKPSENPQQKQR